MVRRFRDRIILFAVAAALAAAWAHPAQARPPYLNAFHTRYPAAMGTRIDACGLCHGTIPQVNAYGAAFRDAGFDFAAIEAQDSDGDGFTNLAEITALTFPGDASDAPPPAPTPTATAQPPTPTSTPLPPTPTDTVLLTATATLPPPTATATAGGRACTGDCNGNHVVTIDDLIKAVNIALERVGVDVCPNADQNGDGAVIISELITAVNNALGTCPVS